MGITPLRRGPVAVGVSDNGEHEPQNDSRSKPAAVEPLSGRRLRDYAELLPDSVGPAEHRATQ